MEDPAVSTELNGSGKTDQPKEPLNNESVTEAIVFKKLTFLFLMLFFVSTVYADTYMGLKPGVSTKEDADRVLGMPVRVVVQGTRYDYSPEEHEAERVSLTFNRSTQVIETINIYPINKYSKKQLREWFELGTPSKTFEDTNGDLVESYGSKGISLHFAGPDADSPVSFFSHFDPALLETSFDENTSGFKQAQEDSAYAWIKIGAERGFFIFRELRKVPTLETLKTIAEKAGRKEMVEKYDDRLTEIDQNINQALATYSDTFRELEKMDPEAIDAGIQKYTEFLKEHDAVEQLKVLETVKEHLSVFLKEKTADKEKWRSDLAGI